MIILGIGGILGDAASAIVKDGQLVAAVEEVKVSRQYRVGALPDASIAACLSMAAAKPEDVDLVAMVRPLATRPSYRRLSGSSRRSTSITITTGSEATYSQRQLAPSGASTAASRMAP